MAVELHANKVRIFKFLSTGMNELFLEVADYITEQRARGHDPEFVALGMDEQVYFADFWKE